jgi:NAD(P)-dependent dehydrogenase (short-subunit alcohol dehydrogenase family)
VAALEEEAAQLGFGPIKYIRCDVSDQAAVDATFEEAIEFMGGLDAMVNSAGAETHEAPETLTAETLEPMFAVNVWGTVFTNIAAFRHYKQNGGGVIINLASYAGVCGMPGMGCYSATKGAVLAWSRTIAKDWAPQNVRVNSVCPAAMTDLAKTFYSELDAEGLAAVNAVLERAILLGGKLSDVNHAANLNIFLASDMASFVHGQTIGVDGGMTMSR